MKRDIRICVMRGGGIGDFILTLPALQLLRQRWPQAYLELVGYPHIAALAVAGGLADRVESLDKAGMARFFVPHASLSEEQQRYVRSFDLIVCYFHDPDGVVAGNLDAAGARQVIRASPHPEAGHAVDHFVRPLEALALYPPPGMCPALSLTAAHLKSIDTPVEPSLAAGPWIAIHPGSGGPRKNWPLQRFVETAGALEALGMGTPVFLFGEADERERAAIQSLRPRARILPQMSLPAVAAALARGSGYVGNDSGITHLAAALGLPVVALFGPTDAAVWAPRGPRVRVLCAAEATTEAMAGIKVQTVTQALVSAIATARTSRTGV